VDTPLLSGRRAKIVLDAGPHEAATLTVAGQRLSYRPGASHAATTLVTSDVATMTAVVEGHESGTRMFLGHRLGARGDLSLALVMDGMFGHDVDGAGRPVHWPRPGMATAGHIPTAYLEAGPADAPTIVMLHGLGATNASLLPLVWSLAPDYHVVAPDLPGFGASGRPRGRYSPAWFAAWLLRFLDALSIESAVLLGNSLGGRIAIEAGMTFERRCAALVLLAPASAFRRLRQWVPVVRLLRPEFGFLPAPNPSHDLVVDGIRTLFSDPDRLPVSWYYAGADEFLRVFRTRTGRVAFLACLRQIYLDEAYGQRGFWDRLPGLAMPALFVWGDRDRLVPASFSRHVRTALPQAGQIVLEDCGHAPQFEHPDETSAIIRGFLAGIDLPAPTGR
jgi:pimeloyl-ACP methyl ester carboxylesterase